MREGWQHIKFADAFYLNMGKTPARADSSLWENGIYPWVSISDMPTGKYVGSTKELLSQKAVDTTHIHLVPKGTVIMSFKLTIGKTAIAPFDLYTNEAIMAFEPKPGIEVLPDFLYYYLQFYRWSGNRAVMGETINKGVISEAYADIPSLDEQQRIVSELDRLASIISDKQQQLRELDNLAQAIFYEMFGDPLTNPKGWEMKKWSEVISVINGKNQKAVENPVGQYVICGSGGVMGRADKYLCPPDSVIIGRKGSINKPILMREYYWNVDTAFGLVPKTECLLVDYFYGFCRCFDFTHLDVSVTMPSLRKADLVQIRMPIPPLNLQQQFAEKVKTIEEQKDVLKQSIAEFENLLAQRMELHFA